LIRAGSSWQKEKEKEKEKDKGSTKSESKSMVASPSLQDIHARLRSNDSSLTKFALVDFVMTKRDAEDLNESLKANTVLQKLRLSHRTLSRLKKGTCHHHPQPLGPYLPSQPLSPQLQSDPCYSSLMESINDVTL
tara:strand:- start:122 stop:526 length:405 start_codon:yes stop_codon:yes gene_type:complete